MILKWTRRWLFDAKGAVLSEYAIILGLIVLVALASLTLFGRNMSQTTTSVYSDLSQTTQVAPVFGPGNVRTGTKYELP